MLAGHEIGALYRWLNGAGVSQRRIAALIGSTQPQVADIIAGRRARVQVYDVLVRIAAGLHIPRERLGLSFWGSDGTWYGPPDAYPGNVTPATTPEEVTAEMLRRHLIAYGGIILVGAPVAGLGELLDELGSPEPVPLPSRLSQVDVVKVRDMTRRLADAGRTYGSNPQVDSAAAASAARLLQVPGPEPVKQALLSAVAERHCHAGWSAFDAGLYRRALHHYARALKLATDASDAYEQAFALHYAGLAAVEHGHPDDGLKMLQCAQVAAWAMPADHDRRAAIQACVLMDSARALAALGETTQAYRHVGMSRELWTPTPTDRTGDLDRAPALLEIDRGRLDTAEQFAATSVRRWEGLSQRAHTLSGIVLATVHVRAGEQRGLALAHHAITGVSRLSSVRARHQLAPLTAALEARPGSDVRELARMARRVAA